MASKTKKTNAGRALKVQVDISYRSVDGISKLFIITTKANGEINKNIADDDDALSELKAFVAAL